MSRLRHVYAMLLVLMERWEEAEQHAEEALAFRLVHETANGQSGHHCGMRHAENLLRVGRCDDAAPRWAHSLVRPFASDQRDSRLVAGLRFRLAAAHLGAGNAQAGRVSLAQAISRGAVFDSENAGVVGSVAKAEAALRANNWRFNDELRSALGDLAWLIDAAPMRTRFIVERDVGGVVPEAGEE